MACLSCSYRLCSEFFVAKGISRNHVLQRLKKQRVRVPAIEAERHLIQVGRKMLCRDLVPRSNDATFQQREGGFDAVRCHVTPDVDASRVLDCLVLASVDPRLHHGLGVALPLIRHHDFDILTDVLFDELGKGPGLDILSLEEAELTAALFDADHDLLIAVLDRTTVHTARADLAPYPGLIHLHNAPQRLRVDLLHSRADAMAEIPCRLVGEAKLPLDLACAHALLGFAEQVGRC